MSSSTGQPMIDYTGGSTWRRCIIATLLSAVVSGIALLLIGHLYRGGLSDSLGDNFSGMVGSLLALVGMSVAGSIFLNEFLESNSQKNSQYDTVSDDFRQDMKKCLVAILAVSLVQIAFLSFSLIPIYGSGGMGGGNHALIVFTATWLFCISCCAILQFDYDMVTVRTRMDRMTRGKTGDITATIASTIGVQDAAMNRGRTDARLAGILGKAFATYDSAAGSDGRPSVRDLWKESRDDSVQRSIDPFSLFASVETMIEKMAGVPEGTSMTSDSGLRTMPRMENSESGRNDRTLYTLYMEFRRLRDYAGVFLSSGNTGLGGKGISDDEKESALDCMMFCALVLQSEVSGVLSHRHTDGIRLEGNRFDNGRLAYVSMRDSTVVGVSFRNADLHHADLRGSSLVRIELSGADCTGVEMSGNIATLTADAGTDLSRWTAEDSRISDLRMDGCVTDHARFENCHITESDIHNVLGRSSFMSNVVVVHVYCRDSDLSLSEFERLRVDETDIVGCSLDACRFSTLRTRDCHLRLTGMTEVHISDAWIESSEFLGARLSGTVTGSTFTGVSFRSHWDDRTEMPGMRFQDCTFDRVSFDGCALGRVDFVRCRLTGVSVDGCEIGRVRFEGCELEGCRTDLRGYADEERFEYDDCRGAFAFGDDQDGI